MDGLCSVGMVNELGCAMRACMRARTVSALCLTLGAVLVPAGPSMALGPLPLPSVWRASAPHGTGASDLMSWSEASCRNYSRWPSLATGTSLAKPTEASNASGPTEVACAAPAAAGVAAQPAWER
jgi:hypothetical protein